MSGEAVELIRSLLLPEVDLVALFNDDSVSELI